jgi:hypothetical protein
MRYRFLGAVALAALVLAGRASADTVGWTDWTSATPSNGTTPGTATGTMMFGTTAVTVNYTGELDANTETNGVGTDYISPSSTYLSSTVSNLPPGGDLITVTGGTAFTDTVTFSKPVSDFLMAFVSLGDPSLDVTYQFNNSAPIQILSTGTGWWGGNINLAYGHNSSGLDTISGQESDGVIQFTGNFDSISWTIPPPGEYWDGWTFGAVTEAAPGAPITGPGGPGPSTVPLPSSALMGLSVLGGLGMIQVARKMLARRMA